MKQDSILLFAFAMALPFAPATAEPWTNNNLPDGCLSCRCGIACVPGTAGWAPYTPGNIATPMTWTNLPATGPHRYFCVRVP